MLNFVILITIKIFHVLDINNALHWVRLGAHVNQHGHFVWDSTKTDIHLIDRVNCVVIAPEVHQYHLLRQKDHCHAHRYFICQADKH